MNDTTLRYIGLSLLAAIAVYISLNVLIFLVIYGDTLMPWTIPYFEDFDNLERLDYRQIGGKWNVRDGVLVQSVENDTDLLAMIPLQLEPDQAYRLQSHIYFRSGNQGGGLMFGLQNNRNLAESHMVRFGADQGQTYLVYGYFDANAEWFPQGDIYSLNLPGIDDGVDLAVDVRGGVYDIRIDGGVVASDIPLLYRGGKTGLTTWFSQIGFDDVSIAPLNAVSVAAAQPTPVPVQPTAVFVQATAIPSNLTAIPVLTGSGTYFTDNFGDVALQSKWRPITGNWQFTDGALVQTQAQGFDFAISYVDPFGQYRLHTSLAHREGVGGGLLFNMPAVDSKRGAHMVRYESDRVLIWGYFDGDGVFQGQGFAQVAPAGNAAHALDVIARESTYDIVLDGQPVVNNVPLTRSGGYIGLTASQSVAAFEEVIVTSVTSEAVVPQTIVYSDGDWIRDGDTITQRATEPVESYYSLGVFGGTFTLSVDLTLAGAESSGGLVFHAPDAVSPIGGSAVRVLGSGNIEWGYIDSQTAFQAEGSIPITVAEGADLIIRVYTGSYDVTYAGQTVATNLPLREKEGWNYFSSLGGVISFMNFKMDFNPAGV